MPVHSGELIGRQSQLITANQPSVFGGDTGSNDTARGIAMVKDSSMGIKALFKIPMNDFHSRTMLNAIKIFQKNRDKNVAMAVEGKDGQFDAKIIELDDLKGNLTVRMNVSNSYPTSVNQRREIANSILQNPPVAQALGLLSPSGTEMLRDLFGTGDFKPPEYDARMHQTRETRQLLEGIAVPVNVMLDDHDAHIASIKDWYESNDGQYASQTNPDALQLVEQHLQQHLEAKAQITLAAGAPPLPGQPGGPGGPMGPSQPPQGGPAAPPQG
jgi:hypothetical protein